MKFGLSLRPSLLSDRDADEDEFFDFLADHIVDLQFQAHRLQSAGMRYGTVVVPQRFARVVGAGCPTILGRRIIAGDVESIGVLVGA